MNIKYKLFLSLLTPVKSFAINIICFKTAYLYEIKSFELSLYFSISKFLGLINLTFSAQSGRYRTNLSLVTSIIESAEEQ